MKRFRVLVTCIFFVNYGLFANCDVKTANDFLNLIKENHPNIKLGNSQKLAAEKNIDLTGQISNPELDFESSVGDSIDGKVYTSSLSLKYNFELGNKRSKRTEYARKASLAGSANSDLVRQDAIIDTVLKLHRLRQIYELIPLYEEAVHAFNKILVKMRGRQSLSPDQQVEKDTLELATSDYELKISKLRSEKNELNKHLSFFIGEECLISKEILPQTVSLDESFKSEKVLEKYSKLRLAKYELEMAEESLKIEQANTYPNLQLGPSFEYEKLNISQTKTVGIALTMDLPIFSLNLGGRAKASQEVISAKINYKNQEIESRLDQDSLIIKYDQLRKSIKNTMSKESLDKKHQRIENLFSRGIISTSLIIESHRQLIEFTGTRYEFELELTETLWNIYNMNGEIEKIKI